MLVVAINPLIRKKKGEIRTCMTVAKLISDKILQISGHNHQNHFFYNSWGKKCRLIYHAAGPLFRYHIKFKNKN